MTNSLNENIRPLQKGFKFLLAFTLFIIFTAPSYGQSPKKYLKNGFYEKAYVNAVYKQNKKVKLKKKYTTVIFESYKTIYAKHSEAISAPESKWQNSYDQLIRLVTYRSKAKHPGVKDKLENILYDKAVLNQLAKKFNEENTKDSNIADNFRNLGKYDQALELYLQMSLRHDQAKPITTLTDQLNLIDCEAKIDYMNQVIGDEYIHEAQEVLKGASKKSAEAAIELINKAESHRPLSIEEEELLTLANLIIGESWLEEARKLVQTSTKKNARLAYELINRARTVRTLTADEEQLLQSAESTGMTRVFLKVKGKAPLHNAETLSGILNKGKKSRWITYYHARNDFQFIDFEMEVNAKRPTVVLGDVRRQVKQNSKKVEYWEEEVDASGNTVKVKKTRLAIAMVAILSRTKTANINWTMSLKDLRDESTVHSEAKSTTNAITNEFVSLESGDILALPENIESDVDLDSQPFPPNEVMLTGIEKQYLNELIKLVNAGEDHMRNINLIVPN